MKKRYKIALFIVLILVLLCAAAVIVIKDVCPPAGPWPQPPWCDVSEQVLNPEQPVDSPKLTITVSVPENTPDDTVVYMEFVDENNMAFMIEAMTRSGTNTWTFASSNLDWEVEHRTTIRYRYMRDNLGFWAAEEFEPDSALTFRTLSSESGTEIHDTVTQWRWMPAPGETIPEVTAQLQPFEPRFNGESFQKGVVHADWWWDAFEPLIPGTNDRMVASGITWVQLAPTWDYTQVGPTPVISNQVGHAYPDDKLRLHIQALQDSGLEVTFAPQICCTAVSADLQTPEWWETWYEQYRNFLLYHVDIANEYGIEYISLNSDWQVYVDKPEGYIARMDAIYDEAQARYNGKMGMNFYIFGNASDGRYFLSPYEGWVPELERWDFLGFAWWAGISSSLDPSAAELDANVEEVFRSVLQPMHDLYDQPLIFTQVSITSVDGGLMGEVGIFDPAIQLWEPYDDRYTLDLEEQALGIDAILRGIARHDYVIGMFPFSYLPGTFPMTKEFNIRDKPAEQILRQWYETIP